MLVTLTFHSEYVGPFVALMLVLLFLVTLPLNLGGLMWDRVFGFAERKIEEVTPETDKVEQSLNRKLWRAEGENRQRTFLIACCCLAVVFVAGCFVPSSWSMHVDLRTGLAMAFTCCAAAALVCFLGPVFFDHKRAWTKASFWLAAVPSVVLFYWIVYELLPFRKIAFVALLICPLVFLYLFMSFRHIDAKSSTEEFEQALARQVTSVPSARKKRKRRRQAKARD